MKRRIEILAPAGSYDGMRAAMNAGCDAVYIGGSSFGARAYADNLDTGSLLDAIDETHIRGKKLYLTVNTLLKEEELTKRLYSFLEKYYLHGLDAVIVQDVGVLHFIHEHFPKLPIHASTQMTLTMAQGANLLRDCGVTRLVTSRELSLNEIKTLRNNTELEIETFVHGALCYCYSGQCLMSSIIGGRSGNRGRCAQPCRMPYQFFSEDLKLSSDREKYLLSPKDINTVALIPELIEAGIDSFKIEGRMKRPEYAAAVSMVYRKYVDLYDELGKEDYYRFLKGKDFAADMTKLQDIFNRGGFSEGYAKTYHGREMMSMDRPNHSGVYVGEVSSVNGSRVSITLEEPVNAQDILEIRGKEAYEFTVKDSAARGKILTTNIGKRPAFLDNSGGKESEIRNELREAGNIGKAAKDKWKPALLLRTGDQVYRTRNNMLLQELAISYLDKPAKQGICGRLKAVRGERLSLTLTDGECSVTAYQDIVQEALKQPMTKEKLLAPIDKTGDTLYYFKELTADAGENIFVPVAWLNDIRREAIGLFKEAVAARYRRSTEDIIISGMETAEAIDSGKSVPISPFGICVSVMAKEQFDMALSFDEVTSVYADYDSFDWNLLPGMVKAAADKRKDFFLILPHICRLSVYERLKREIASITGQALIKGCIVKNFEEIALLESLRKDMDGIREIIPDHNMYVYNREAKSFWKDFGITHFSAPVELNYRELKNLGISDCDLLVYGYLPLMVSAQCLYENTGGCQRGRDGNEGKREKSNKAEEGYKKGILTDRRNKKFYVKANCKACNNVIYNGQCLSLLKQAREVTGLKPGSIRLDFTMESGEETGRVLKAFLDAYLYGREASLDNPDTTTGHFRRGVE